MIFYLNGFKLAFGYEIVSFDEINVIFVIVGSAKNVQPFFLNLYHASACSSFGQFTKKLKFLVEVVIIYAVCHDVVFFVTASDYHVASSLKNGKTVSGFLKWG